VLPRDVLTIFPPDDRVALFVVSLCMASNDIEDALTEIEAFPRENVEGDELFFRRRFSYRVRLLGGHLYEGTVALKAWRRSEPGVRELLGKLNSEAKEALSLVCNLEQKIGPKALEAIRQNSFHYPHPDPRRVPDSTVDLADAIRVNPDLEAAVDQGDDRRGTFRFADQLALAIAYGRHDPGGGYQQASMARRAAYAFVRLAADVYIAYASENEFGFEIVD
jgi:hypothetical protein